MALPVFTDGGQVEITDDLDTPTITVELIGLAWSLGGLIGFSRPRPVMFMNRRRTGNHGFKRYPPIPIEARLSLPFLVIGECDHNGDTFSNRAAGLTSNLNYLATNVFEADARFMRHTDAAGFVRVGPVQFEDYPTSDGYGGDTVESTLGILLPEWLVPE